MPQYQIAAIRLRAVHRRVIPQDILRKRTVPARIIDPPITARNLHLQRTGNHLSIVSIVEPPNSLAIIIGLELPAFLPRTVPAGLRQLRHQGWRWERFTQVG